MLKNGQKVQVDPTAVFGPALSAGTPAKSAGIITTIVSYVSADAYNNGTQIELYEIATGEKAARDTLWPIDDEPCEEGFLVDFKELINEKEMV